MCSRDPGLLDAELRRRLHCVLRDHRAEYPQDPRAFVTCTYRTNAQQAEVWAQGRTTPGKIVTYAEPGDSPHNSNPSMAVDVAFRALDGTLDWSHAPFQHLGDIAMRYGIEWGGHWLTGTRAWNDECHLQVPGWRNGGGHDPWPEMPKEDV